LRLLGRLVEYFDLSRLPPGRRSYRAHGLGPEEACYPAGPAGEAAPPPPRPSPLHTLGHYVALALGVLAKYFIESAQGGARVSWVTVLSAVILAAVIFPYVYRRACDPAQARGMQFFVSFQHGFFFQTVLEVVQGALI